ncbi:hypothetical protein HYY73_05745 [Candidatus Woesearchaeota archaeon]|nr:hypothetical protein [Candidatus Woesearchaeota archaeon]
MRNTPTLAIAAILALTMLLVAACAPKEAGPQQPSAPETPAATPAEQPLPPAAAEVPEIAQAEQAVQEIGTSGLDEVESGLDELVLP